MLVVALMGAAWAAVVVALGVWDVMRVPSAGVLSHTFNGWIEYPETRYLLAQYGANEFSEGKAYATYPYPFLLAMYLIVEPVHLAFRVPYEIAHNVSAYVNVAGLGLLLFVTARGRLVTIFSRWSPLEWGLAFAAIGIVVTGPLPWVSLLLFNRDNFHVASIAAFCYLSVGAFTDREPRRALLVVGLFLALWSPIYVPAWVLAVVFFQRTLTLDRRWMLEIGGVVALAGVNHLLPGWVTDWAGYRSVSSSALFRTGLDGSTDYMTSVAQAVVAPFDPRRWPIALPLVTAAAFAVAAHAGFRRHPTLRPIRQALFLAIPYATVAIALPQFTSIHPYFTDLLLLVPASFLPAFWLLQQECWQTMTGRRYVAWLLAASLAIMSNLLTIAQAMDTPLAAR